MKSCLLLLSLALAACMTMPESTTRAATSPAAEKTLPASASTLSGRHWQLHDAVDGSNHRLEALFGTSGKPLQLDFNADRINISNACNRISGGYRIVDGHLITAQLVQTMMACADPTLMQRESTIKAVLQGKPTLIVSTGDDGMQLLTLAADSGQTLVFAGKPTAEARYGGPGETVFLEVAAQSTPCHHPLIANKSCLRVRERHYDAQGLQSGQPGPWQTLQQDIEGYQHQPGTRNVLRVKRYTVKQPPADGSSVAYVLDMVVESELVKSGDATAPAQAH
jgi:heat shock protein HslJ